MEYSFFPYSEFTRRQLTFQYTVGANSYEYMEQTNYEFTIRIGFSYTFGSIFNTVVNSRLQEERRGGGGGMNRR